MTEPVEKETAVDAKHVETRVITVSEVLEEAKLKSLSDLSAGDCCSYTPYASSSSCVLL